MTRTDRRFARQLSRMQRRVPYLGRTLQFGSRLRALTGVLLILGGLMGFLPVLGFWMLPLGLLLLAVDLPVLRPSVSSGMVRMRKITRRWRWQRRG